MILYSQQDSQAHAQQQTQAQSWVASMSNDDFHASSQELLGKFALLCSAPSCSCSFSFSSSPSLCLFPRRGRETLAHDKTSAMESREKNTANCLVSSPCRLFRSVVRNLVEDPSSYGSRLQIIPRFNTSSFSHFFPFLFLVFLPPFLVSCLPSTIPRTGQRQLRWDVDRKSVV